MPEPDETSADSQSPFPESSDPLIGTEWESRYLIVEKIGHGGMGRIYKAHHKFLDETVAIKFMQQSLLSSERGLQRFKQEAKSLTKLTDPNLVKLLSMGISKEAIPYLVLEYLEGESLASVLKKEKVLTAEKALPIFKQICKGLLSAHRAGVIHRDLKPSNIILTSNKDGEEKAKIVDFGIAYLLSESNPRQQLTQTGVLIGSPDYMSPEQIQGAELDGRTDIYSLGCLIYETLIGQPPFHEENALLTMNRHLSEPLESLSFPNNFPNGMHSLILRMLEKKPENRFQDISAVMEALGSVNLDEKTTFIKPPLRLKKPIQYPVSSAIIYGITALAIAGYAYHLARRMLHQSTNSVIASPASTVSLLKSSKFPSPAWLDKKYPSDRAKLDFYLTWLRMHDRDANVTPNDIFAAYLGSINLKNKLGFPEGDESIDQAIRKIHVYRRSLKPSDKNYWSDFCTAKLLETRCFLNLKDYKHAANLLQEVLEHCNNHLENSTRIKIEALTLLGDIYHEQQNYKEAEKYYLEAHEAIPPDAMPFYEASRCRFQLANNYLSMDDKKNTLRWLKIAEEDYRRSVLQKEDKASVLDRFANTYMKAEDLQNTLRTSLQALDIRKSLPDSSVGALAACYHTCGKALVLSGDPQAAYELYKKGYPAVLERCKHGREEILKRRRNSFLDTSRISFSNDLAPALMILGWQAQCLFFLKRYVEGEQLFKDGYRMLTAEPDNFPNGCPEFLTVYADSLNSRGEFFRAQTMLESEIFTITEPLQKDKFSKTNTRALSWLKLALAESYLYSGNKKEAEKNCREAESLLEICPYNEILTARLMTLQTKLRRKKS